ncbi:MAG: hypothetical protein AAF750_12170, partial [Planctomycetota bacterium]
LRDAENRVQSSGQQFAGLEKERQMLVEVKRFLEASEAQMVKKWATAKAASLVVGVMITVAALAGAAYLAGQRLATPIHQATLSLEVTGGTDSTGTLTPGPTPADFIQDTLLAKPVLNATLTQLDRTPPRYFSSTEALQADLLQHLTATGQPNSIQLQYTHPDGDRAVAVLDALRASAAAFRMSEDRKAGREDTFRVTQPAAKLDMPVKDERLLYTGYIFAGSLGAALLLFGGAKLIASRAGRSFDDDDPRVQFLDKPDTWSPVKATDD